MKFTIYQESRPGARPNNEDRIAYSYSRDALMMVVADGMGGHLHGEVAAQIAVQYVTENFQRNAHPTIEDPLSFLSGALTNAHHAILDYVTDHALEDAPRTTCVACIVQDSIAYWAHSGDSRLYLIRDGKAIGKTKDHSRVQRLLQEGLISEKEALTHPSRNRIFSCLGGQQLPQIDFSRKMPLMAGDVIALCTDGAWGPLPEEHFVKLLGTGNVMQAVPALLIKAEAEAGRVADNLSMIAMRWEDNYDGDTVGTVLTRTMPLDSFTTQMEEFGKAHQGQQHVDLSDEEIEKAINEINNAIGKYSK